MKTKTAAVFAAVQGLGAIGFLLWESVNSPALLVASWVLLLPGNVIASYIVTATLWSSGLSLRTLSLCSLAITIAVNGATWGLVSSAYRRYRRRQQT